jgi:predicted dehydrogenase
MLIARADVAVAVENDDHAQMMCRFARGGREVMGHLYFSRIATGRKMGYAYEMHGTKGAIRFDQEDQNALWLYRLKGRRHTRGFTKILTGPDAPQLPCLLSGAGPWHRLSGSDHHRGARFSACH